MNVMRQLKKKQFEQFLFLSTKSKSACFNLFNPNNAQVVQGILDSAENGPGLVANESFIFIRNIIILACNDNELKSFIPEEFIVHSVNSCFKWIDRNRPISKSAFKALQSISCDDTLIRIALSLGLENKIVAALSVFPQLEFIPLIYSIVYNIISFCDKNCFSYKKISTNKIFFTKTAENIMISTPTELEFILSTLDMLGNEFWKFFYVIMYLNQY